MTALSRDELQTAVQQCLGDQFATQLTENDQVDEKASKWELLRFASLIVLQNPDTIYYLASLFRDDLQKKVDALVESLQEALGVVDDTLIKYREPENKLLDTAETALTRAYSAYSDGKTSPFAINQAKEALGEYADDIGDQLVSGGSMARTSVLAKSVIQSAVSGLETSVSEITTGAQTLVDLDLDSQVLENIYAGVTIKRISSLLSEKRSKLSETATQLALEQEIRDLYLFLKVSERILGSRSNYPQPDDSRWIGDLGPANTVTDLADTVEPAAIGATESLPLVITPANKTFTIEINGGNQVITLAESPKARILSLLPQNYDIYAPQRATITGTVVQPFFFAFNELWRVWVDGIYFEGTIPNGNYTCDQLITILIANISHPVEGAIDNWLDLVNVANKLRLTFNHAGETTGDHRIIIGNYNTANLIMGFTDGEDSDDTGDVNTIEGVKGNREIKFVVNSLAEQTVTLTTGIGRTAAQIGADIDAVLTPDGASGADGTKVYVESASRGDGGRIKVTGGDALETLGFYLNQEIKSYHRQAQEVVHDITGQITNARAYTTLTEKSSGVCQTVVGVGNEDLIDLPAGEGAQVAVGQVIIVQAGPNAGAYRIQAGPPADQITVDRDQFVTAGPLDQQYVVVTDLLTLESTKLDALDSSMYSAAATLFGFPTVKDWGQVSDLYSADGFRYVRAGDLATMTAVQYVIQRVEATRVVVDPLVDMNAGSASAVVRSADEKSYADAQTLLTAWKQNYESSYPHYGDLTVAVNRLLNSTSYVNRTQVKSLLTTLLAEFTGVGSVSEILGDVTCRPLKPIERLLEALEERGSDRGKELLRALQFTQFFDFGAQLSYNRLAFDKLAELLREYRPVEAAVDDVPDYIQEDSEVPGVEEDDLEADDMPADMSLEPDEEIEL